MTQKSAIIEITGTTLASLTPADVAGDRPVVWRNLANDWPVIQQARESDADFIATLCSYDAGLPITLYRADASADGRIFYNDDMTGFNFSPEHASFAEFTAQLLNPKEANDTLYMGSTMLNRWFPAFSQANPLPLASLHPLVSLWVGNQSHVAAHFDFPDNLAIVIAGRRRFTLFPPEQVSNLYIGPLEFTPAGQPISLVDARNPDFTRFPRYQTALEHAITVELEPGDALYIPSMWWHQVESLAPVNGLVNFWWRSTPHFLGNPFDALRHCLLSIGQLPAHQRLAWQAMFEHFVFNRADDAFAHIPEHNRGAVGEIDETTARRLRADLLNKFNR